MFAMLRTDSRVSPRLSGPLRSSHLLLRHCLAAAVLPGGPRASRAGQAPARGGCCQPGFTTSQHRAASAGKRIKPGKLIPRASSAPSPEAKTLPPVPPPQRARCNLTANSANKNKQWLTAGRPVLEGPGSEGAAGAKRQVLSCTFQRASLQSCLPLSGFGVCFGLFFFFL